MRDSVKGYTISGKHVQGVGLRKLYHKLLEEEGANGLAVNDPSKGVVELSIGGDRKDIVLQRLKKAIRAKTGHAIDINPNEGLGKLKDIHLNTKNLDALNRKHNLAFRQSHLAGPRNSELDSMDKFKESIMKRYLLKKKGEGLAGRVPQLAHDQLTGKTVPYELMLPKHQVRSVEEADKLLKQAADDVTTTIGNAGKSTAGLASSINKTVSSPTASKLSQASPKPIKNLNEQSARNTAHAFRGAAIAEPYAPSKIAFKQLMEGGKGAYKGGFNFNSTGAGPYQAERKAAADLAPKLVQQYKDAKLPVFRGRVKTAASMNKAIAAGRMPATGAVPADLLGMQMYAQTPKEYGNILDILHKKQGLKNIKVNLFNNKAYKGLNITGMKGKVPTELQISPGKFANMNQLTMHDIGGYLKSKNIKGTQKGDVAVTRALSKLSKTPKTWKGFPQGRGQLVTTNAAGEFVNPFTTGKPLDIVKHDPATKFQQTLKSIKGPSRILAKSAPYLWAADAATGALAPDGKVESFQSSVNDMKTRSMWPGWNQQAPTPTDPDAIEKGSWGSATMTDEEKNKKRGAYTGYQSGRANNWGYNWIGDAGKTWDSFNLGKPGATVNAALAAPSAAVSTVAQPVWDWFRNRNNRPINKSDLRVERAAMNARRAKLGRAPLEKKGMLIKGASLASARVGKILKGFDWVKAGRKKGLAKKVKPIKRMTNPISSTFKGVKPIKSY